jgi:hypothetical protein
VREKPRRSASGSTAPSPIEQRRSDVIDAALVLLADDGDRIITSDAGDLEPLAAAAGLEIELIEP